VHLSGRKIFREYCLLKFLPELGNEWQPIVNVGKMAKSFRFAID
jgi:hypothetical protein